MGLAEPPPEKTNRSISFVQLGSLPSRSLGRRPEKTNRSISFVQCPAPVASRSALAARKDQPLNQLCSAVSFTMVWDSRISFPKRPTAQSALFRATKVPGLARSRSTRKDQPLNQLCSEEEEPELGRDCQPEKTNRSISFVQVIPLSIDRVRGSPKRPTAQSALFSNRGLPPQSTRQAPEKTNRSISFVQSGAVAMKERLGPTPEKTNRSISFVQALCLRSAVQANWLPKRPTAQSALFSRAPRSPTRRSVWSRKDQPLNQLCSVGTGREQTDAQRPEKTNRSISFVQRSILER